MKNFHALKWHLQNLLKLKEFQSNDFSGFNSCKTNRFVVNDKTSNTALSKTCLVSKCSYRSHCARAKFRPNHETDSHFDRMD